LEHHYQALHTATDGIFTQRRPDVSGKHRVVEKAARLGDLTHEAKGDLVIVRNKCYVLYGKSGDESTIFPGKKITKYALHGFQGSVQTLERLIATGERKYTVDKPNKLRESVQRGLTPNQWRKREMNLNVGAISLSPRRARRGTNEDNTKDDNSSMPQ
jgi:hypothetical protein